MTLYGINERLKKDGLVAIDFEYDEPEFDSVQWFTSGWFKDQQNKEYEFESTYSNDDITEFEWKEIK